MNNSVNIEKKKSYTKYALRLPAGTTTTTTQKNTGKVNDANGMICQIQRSSLDELTERTK